MAASHAVARSDLCTITFLVQHLFAPRKPGLHTHKQANLCVYGNPHRVTRLDKPRQILSLGARFHRMSLLVAGEVSSKLL
jgi:hypothetical protein